MCVHVCTCVKNLASPYSLTFPPPDYAVGWADILGFRICPFVVTVATTDKVHPAVVISLSAV